MFNSEKKKFSKETKDRSEKQKETRTIQYSFKYLRGKFG